MLDDLGNYGVEIVDDPIIFTLAQRPQLLNSKRPTSFMHGNCGKLVIVLCTPRTLPANIKLFAKLEGSLVFSHPKRSINIPGITEEWIEVIPLSNECSNFKSELVCIFDILEFAGCLSLHIRAANINCSLTRKSIAAYDQTIALSSIISAGTVTSIVPSNASINEIPKFYFSSVLPMHFRIGSETFSLNLYSRYYGSGSRNVVNDRSPKCDDSHAVDAFYQRNVNTKLHLIAELIDVCILGNEKLIIHLLSEFARMSMISDALSWCVGGLKCYGLIRSSMKLLSGRSISIFDTAFTVVLRCGNYNATKILLERCGQHCFPTVNAMLKISFPALTESLQDIQYTDTFATNFAIHCAVQGGNILCLEVILKFFQRYFQDILHEFPACYLTHEDLNIAAFPLVDEDGRPRVTARPPRRIVYEDSKVQKSFVFGRIKCPDVSFIRAKCCCAPIRIYLQDDPVLLYDNYTPMMIACSSGSLGMCELLYKHSRSSLTVSEAVHEVKLDGDTVSGDRIRSLMNCLMLSSYCGSVEVFSWLLSLRKPKSEYRKLETPVRRSRIHGIFRKFADIPLHQKLIVTPSSRLLFSLELSYVSSRYRLYCGKLDLECQSSLCGMNSFMLAVANRRKGIVDRIISLNFESQNSQRDLLFPWESVNKFGDNVFHIATRAIVQCVLEKAALDESSLNDSVIILKALLRAYIRYYYLISINSEESLRDNCLLRKNIFGVSPVDIAVYFHFHIEHLIIHQNLINDLNAACFALYSIKYKGMEALENKRMVVVWISGSNTWGWRASEHDKTPSTTLSMTEKASLFLHNMKIWRVGAFRRSFNEIDDDDLKYPQPHENSVIESGDVSVEEACSNSCKSSDLDSVLNAKLFSYEDMKLRGYFSTTHSDGLQSATREDPFQLVTCDNVDTVEETEFALAIQWKKDSSDEYYVKTRVLDSFLFEKDDLVIQNSNSNEE